MTNKMTRLAEVEGVAIITYTNLDEIEVECTRRFELEDLRVAAAAENLEISRARDSAWAEQIVTLHEA